ncbi:hypothetical protein [Paracidobacterium acidisoli]|uniref:hypothetical protein n=1 Tax=Paracidobacterium acidisoli TaxID=2303751 RepID=UPI000E3ECA1B|nr:hypothetical protein [Paracidobacterium acidisoli]MBT9331095.1 hypothetical protein [Paracidobacterium acidisoli]
MAFMVAEFAVILLQISTGSLPWRAVSTATFAARRAQPVVADLKICTKDGESELIQAGLLRILTPKGGCTAEGQPAAVR